MRRILLLALLTPSAILNAQAACEVASTAARPHIVELYTSEGCDSCPPAEQWMSTLLKHDDLVGLEFHVDYWDSSSWRDPFSEHAYTARQQTLAKRGGHGQVYTPQIWLDGHLWANWPKGSPPTQVDTSPPALRLAVVQEEPLQFKVDGDNGPPGSDYRIYAALTENGLSKHVSGGENHGKTLAHDEVVRAFAGPMALPHAEAALKMPKGIDMGRSSVVAFVQDERDGSIVQAVRLPLSECKR
jgi:hypothetical protein